MSPQDDNAPRHGPLGWAPTLRIYECEGHGRYFEVFDADEGHAYLGTFEYDGEELRRRFGGSLAYVYSYAAWEALDEDDRGNGDVPDPVLAVVRAVDGCRCPAWAILADVCPCWIVAHGPCLVCGAYNGDHDAGCPVERKVSA